MQKVLKTAFKYAEIGDLFTRIHVKGIITTLELIFAMVIGTVMKIESNKRWVFHFFTTVSITSRFIS